MRILAFEILNQRGVYCACSGRASFDTDDAHRSCRDCQCSVDAARTKWKRECSNLGRRRCPLPWKKTDAKKLSPVVACHGMSRPVAARRVLSCPVAILRPLLRLWMSLRVERLRGMRNADHVDEGYRDKRLPISSSDSKSRNFTNENWLKNPSRPSRPWPLLEKSGMKPTSVVKLWAPPAPTVISTGCM